VIHAIDIDRDTNGAGIVYFANYVAFMNRAERETIDPMPPAPAAGPTAVRVIQQRRIAYFGNASTSDRIHTRVRVFRREAEHRRSRSARTRREEDGDSSASRSHQSALPAFAAAHAD
jgi:probable biosynthetic protein (TIGR04098 family)